MANASHSMLSSSCASETSTDGSVATVSDVLDLGARLLGETHCVHLQLRCASAHASFFVLPEDAWLTYAPAVRRRSNLL